MTIDSLFVIGGALSLGAVGYGVSCGIAASRGLLSFYQHHDEAQADGRSDNHRANISFVRQPQTQLRTTSIAGLMGDYVRHRDGSYSCAWHVEMMPTMLAEDFYLEDKRRQLARALAAELPKGSVIQWRWRVVPDYGELIDAARRASKGAEVHPAANELCELNTAFIEGQAASGGFRRDVLTLWVRVPARLPGDHHEGIGGSLARVGRDVRRSGASGVIKAVARGYQHLDDGKVKRLLDDEREAARRAERFFANIEGGCPLKLKRFARTELWHALFGGHNLNARHIPAEPMYDGLDIGDYLCGETIQGESWYLLHGNTPLTIVSMIKPPNETINEKTVRHFATHPDLTFNHTTLIEYVPLDRKKTKKRLDKLIDRTKKTNKSFGTGKEKYTPEALRKVKELEAVRMELTRAGEALIQCRFRVVIFGEPVRTQANLHDSLKELERRRDKVVEAMQEMPGCLARSESPAALRAQYRHLVVGELDARPTGREIEEVTDSLSCLAPMENAFTGMRHPHSIFPTVTRRLTGYDLLGTQLGSTVTTVLGTKSAGKSTIMGTLLLDFLGRKHRPAADVCDYGLTFESVCEVLGGQHWRFDFARPRPVNVMDYPGLYDGAKPDFQQLSLVVEDLRRLAGADTKDTVARDILTLVVGAVYRNELAYNEISDGERREPRLSHVLNMLDAYPFDTLAHTNRAADLKIGLEKWRDHEWLDQPTDAAYRNGNSLNVYELRDLEAFPPDVRDSMTFRIAARITQAVGRIDSEGQINPRLGIFDEIWRYPKQFPAIIEVMQIVARTGRKEGFALICASHSQKDFDPITDITKTAGMRIIGKQAGSFDDLIKEARLSPEAVAAVGAISNITGVRRQYVVVCDFEDGQVVEMIENRQSPILYWTMTSAVNERNARRRAMDLVPGWELKDAIAYLAATYPQGLEIAGRTTLDETPLTVENEADNFA